MSILENVLRDLADLPNTTTKDLKLIQSLDQQTTGFQNFPS